MTFEIWQDETRGVTVVNVSEKGILIPAGSELLHRFEADTVTEAMRKFQDLMGWNVVQIPTSDNKS